MISDDISITNAKMIVTYILLITVTLPRRKFIIRNDGKKRITILYFYNFILLYIIIIIIHYCRCGEIDEIFMSYSYIFYIIIRVCVIIKSVPRLDRFNFNKSILKNLKD